MNKTRLLCVVLLAGACVGSRSAPPAPLATPKPDVVGGVVAPAHSAGWQVALFRTGQTPVDGLFCGGVQLSDTWVLTAAHCFFSTDCKQMGFGSVWVGHGQQSLRNDIARREIAEVLFEPGAGFDCASKANDIALVRLKKPIPNSVAIRLPTESQAQNEPQPGKVMQIVGWGKTFENGQLQQQLMEAPLPVQDRSVCVAKHGNLPQGVICAGGRREDACTGDSGGPLFVRQGGQNATIFGIVSYSRGCGRQGIPGVYTAIGPRLNWINGVVKPPGCTAHEIAMKLC